MRMGFDLDGVIYDFVSCSRRACDLAYPGRAGDFFEEAYAWDFFSSQWALSATEFWDAVRAHEATFASQPLTEGWMQLFEAFHSDGHTTHAVTARMMHWGNTRDHSERKRRATVVRGPRSARGEDGHDG